MFIYFIDLQLHLVISYDYFYFCFMAYSGSSFISDFIFEYSFCLLAGLAKCLSTACIFSKTNFYFC